MYARLNPIGRLYFFVVIYFLNNAKMPLPTYRVTFYIDADTLHYRNFLINGFSMFIMVVKNFRDLSVECFIG